MLRALKQVEFFRVSCRKTTTKATELRFDCLDTVEITGRLKRCFFLFFEIYISVIQPITTKSLHISV